MAQIVTIADGTKRDINNLGDIVEIQDDHVKLGPAYRTFKVIEVPGVTATELRAKLQAQVPKIESRSIDGKELTEESETKEMWLDGEVWKLVENSPKYQLNMPVDATKEAQLLDDKVDRIALLETTAVANIRTDNQTVFVAPVIKVIK